MKRCTHCGRIIPIDAPYCRHCGKEQHEATDYDGSMESAPGRNKEEVIVMDTAPASI